VDLHIGTTEVPYSYQLEATSSITPITWSLKNGSTLLQGLTLSPTGKIEGTPLQHGTREFTVVATNTDGSTEKFLALTIFEAAKISSVDIRYDGGASVKKGREKVFYPVVTGTGDYHDVVTWKITGYNNPGTTINSSGLLRQLPIKMKPNLKR